MMFHILRQGVNVSSSFAQQFGPDKGTSLFTEIKLNYQVVVSVSPILLLLPKRLGLKKFAQHSLLSV
jgi:hypothetical protein